MLVDLPAVVLVVGPIKCLLKRRKNNGQVDVPRATKPRLRLDALVDPMEDALLRIILVTEKPCVQVFEPLHNVAALHLLLNFSCR